MGDIQSPGLLYLKAVLFVVTGCLAAGLLLLEHPEPRTAALLGIAIWAFARAYYFAFYVVEHWVDPGFRYAGLGAFVLDTWTRARRALTRPGAARGPGPG